jgi:sulfatase maturation enzyme AslB (radical SAM superfamily)
MNKWITVNDIKKIEIELSSYCNARCPLCIRQHRGTDVEREDFAKGHLKFSQIKKLISDLPDPKQVTFYFGGVGGDPMMNPEVVDIFKYCSEKLKDVSMDTNASLRSANIWKELGEISSKYGTSITFSIDGLEDTNHLYRIKTDWTKIMKNSAEFISAGGNAHWKYIVFKHNEHQVEEARELSKKLGFKEFSYENSVRHWDNIGPLQPLPPTNVEKEKIKTHAAKISVKEISCRTIELKMLYVSNNFLLFPCCYWHSWYTYEKDVLENYMNMNNNLNERSLTDIINDDFFTNKLINDWKLFNPDICSRTCNQVKYWKRNIQRIANE